MKRCHARFAALAITAIISLPAAAFAAGAACPSGGVPGSGATVFGGLEVDGKCVLNNVTIHGGVVVDPAGGLELENSVVYNGIVVNGGELDLGHLLSTGSSGTGNPNTINGGIVINGALDFDIFNVTLNGGLNVTGTINEFPAVCGSTISGNVNIDGATVNGYILIGDPEAESGFVCAGNNVNGSMLVGNTTGLVELEGNTVTGSAALVNANNIEFDGNTIGGSAVCSATTIKPPAGADPFGNTVKGLLNNCPS